MSHGLRILFTGLGIFCLLYFVTYAVLTGLTNIFTYFWLLFGALLMVIAVFYPRISKRVHAMPIQVKVVFGAVFFLCLLVFVVAEGLIIGYGAASPRAGADYVIVLGAQVRGQEPSYNLARRLDKAYEYLQENPDTKAVLSGGQGPGEDISEAEAMAEYLEKLGIDRDRMLLEERSTNTEENFIYSREMITGDVRVVVVTSNFHVYRSLRIARKQGLTQVEGLGADVMWFTIPNLYVREAFALVKYALCGQL